MGVKVTCASTCITNIVDAAQILAANMGAKVTCASTCITNIVDAAQILALQGLSAAVKLVDHTSQKHNRLQE